jgi:hypothetical protein
MCYYKVRTSVLVGLSSSLEERRVCHVQIHNILESRCNARTVVALLLLPPPGMGLLRGVGEF